MGLVLAWDRGDYLRHLGDLGIYFTHRIFTTSGVHGPFLFFLLHLIPFRIAGHYVCILHDGMWDGYD